MITVGINNWRKHVGKLKIIIWGLCLLLIFVSIALQYRSVFADEGSAVVIYSVQVGDMTSNSNEFIQIVNRTDAAVDVTDWCIRYRSAPLSSSSQVLCLTPTQPEGRLLLPPRATATFVSAAYIMNYQVSIHDGSFSVTLSGAGGHLDLINQDGQTVDRLGWGTALSPEGTAAIPSSNTGFMQRKSISGAVQDTNNNGADFIVAPYTWINLVHGLLYEAVASTEPIEEGSPEEEVPESSGPEEPVVSPPEQPIITEILPNPTGSDADNEFIELYNPLTTRLMLDGYTIQLGDPVTKIVSLNGLAIESKSYLAVFNSTHSFTLVNTGGHIELSTPSGAIVNTVDYPTSPDGESWSLIVGAWQYSNAPTPGAENIPSFSFASVEPEGTSDTLTPCPAGQYRNPETNRCRKTASDQGSTLVPCKEGQERNLETNRCRTIASSSSSALTACKEGQQRNEETNRCRKVTASTPPTVDYGVRGAAVQNETSLYILWVTIGIAILGFGYVVWEWRVEIVKFLRRVRDRWRRKK